MLYSNLSTGTTKSCGCLRREACRARERKKNHRTHGVVLSYYKRNAKLRGLEWSLSPEQFTELIGRPCRYCKALPAVHVLVGRELFYNGIDRVDNQQGYTPENCVPCCATCNRAKLAMSLDDFKQWISKVHEVLHGDFLH